MNGTLICRGAKADYDRIASMGNPGWSWDEMLPFFKASETFHPAEWHQEDSSVHGTSGPLHTGPHQLAPISEKVLESFITVVMNTNQTCLHRANSKVCVFYTLML